MSISFDDNHYITGSHLSLKNHIIKTLDIKFQCIIKKKKDLFFFFSSLLVPKVNVIEWVDFELASFKVSVQHFRHYTTMSRGILFSFCLFLDGLFK